MRNKKANLLRSLWKSCFSYTAPFVRIIPTDRCNLSCSYCFQKSDDPREMTRSEFDANLEKAGELGTGLITFLGGEPLAWPHIVHAVESCTRKGIFSDLTTNGTLLDRETIHALGRAGLDFLNISVDVTRKGTVSAKNAIRKPAILRELLAARNQYGMRVRVNAVFWKDNSREVKDLVEFTHLHGIPLSIGFVVPEPGSASTGGGGIRFTADDRELLDAFTGYIIDRKRKGYRIIDPTSYFRNVHRFLRREKFWDCNYQRQFGWLNVTPAGRIRSCTKMMDELDDHFLDLTPERIRELRRGFAKKIEQCNTQCYSNCAYNGYYLFRFLPFVIAGAFLTSLVRSLRSGPGRWLKKGELPVSSVSMMQQ